MGAKQIHKNSSVSCYGYSLVGVSIGYEKDL